jgi:2-polyprenyl-6-methoxyphenol hydroxylase-like FAD-dependent oxidoreductase
MSLTRRDHSRAGRRVRGTPGRGVDYDVLIIGARCAGAATALLLARAGLRVLAVDRARYGTDTLSTHALTRTGVHLLGRWGVLDRVRAAGTPTVTRVVHHYGEDAVDLPIRAVGDLDGLYAPRRHVLDRILVDAAVACGAEVRHEASVRDLVFTDDGRVRGAVVRERGRLSTISARLVIGADGARSGTAKRVAAPTEYAARHSSATVYTYVDGLPDDAYHNYFRPGVAAGLIPTNGGAANVWVGVPMGRLRGGGHAGAGRLFAEALCEAAPELSARVADAAAGHRFRAFPGLPGLARRCWGRGWALVGDAAYFKDPISAHGMTDALVGAELLARAVLAIAGGQTERRAMTTYADQRRRLITPMMRAVDLAASYRWDLDEIRQAQLEMSAAMRAEWLQISGLG